MNVNESLFTQALQLPEAWYVEYSEFDHEAGVLGLHLNFKRGSNFTCPTCGKEVKAYDTKEKTWRHLNFFQYRCEITARVPRVKCEDHGVLQVAVPWARSGSSLTLLFEAISLTLIREMPVSAAARILGEDDEKLWRVADHYVEEALSEADYSDVSVIGVDETSKGKGHDYVSIVVDLEKKKAIFVEEGRDSEVLDKFRKNLEEHGGKAENIKHVSIDMSRAFIKGVKDNFPQADITFDRFHIMKVLNKAVDEVRKMEVTDEEDLKKTKYLWLKNREELTAAQSRKLLNFEAITELVPSKMVKAYHIKETFQAIYKEKTLKGFVFQLKQWYFWATHSKIPQMIKAAKTIKAHWDGVVQWFKTRLTNAILEGFNSLIQAAKSKARGYRTFKNYKIVIFLLTGKLDFSRITHTI